MNRKLYLVIVIIFSINNLFAQEWINSTAITSSGLVNSKEILSNEGNNYVTGIFSGTIGGALTSYGSNDWFLARYNSSFNIDWIKQIGSTGQERDVSMAFNSNRDIIIGGSFVNTCYFSENDSLVSDGLYDIMLAKYNKNNGNLIWKKTIAWGKSGQLIASLSVDNNDDIIVTGFYRDSLITSSEKIKGTGFQNFILKLDSEGNFIWIKNILSSNTATRISAVSAFSDGYYISGTYKDNIYFDMDTLNADVSGKAKVFLYKLDFNGDGVWARSSYGNNDDATGTIAQDSYGNVYLSGYYRSTNFRFDKNETEVTENITNNGGSDIFIIKYNKTGNLIWLKGYGENGSDYAIDLKIKQNTLYFTGYFSDTLFINGDTLFNSNTANKDVFLAAADSKGNLLKGEALKGEGVFDDYGSALEISSNTHALLVGDFYSPSITIGENILNNAISPSPQVFIAEYIPPFVAAFTKKTNPTCYGYTNGDLIVTPYFGVLPYTYDWSHDANLHDSTATGLTAGTYSVTVTDALDSIAIAEYTLVEPDSFMFSPAVTNITTCSYDITGAINLNVTGGNGDNSYFWFESEGGSGVGLTDEDQSGLTAGKYCVTVTDSKGCTGDTVIYITAPQPVIFSGSSVTDDSGVDPLHNGAVDLELTGGIGTPSAYGAVWTGPSGFNAAVQDISALAAGTYNVEVTDGNGCIFDSSFTVRDLDTLFAYISYKKDDCAGGSGDGKATVSYYTPNTNAVISYLWSTGATTATVTGLTAGNKYFVTVTDSDLSETSVDSVEILDLGYSMVSALTGTSAVDCKGDTDGYVDLSLSTPGIAPYTYSWSNGATTQDIVNIPAGTYNVTVTDVNECIIISSDHIITEPEFDLSASASIVSTPLCNGDYNGSVRVDAGGGNVGVYTYQWNDPGFQTSQIADGIDAGFYTATVTDIKGCTTTASVSLTQPAAIKVIKNINHVDCNAGSNGSVQLTVSGGTPTFSYFWTTDGGSGLEETQKDQSGLTAGNYYFTATDANNCFYEDSIEITEPAVLEIVSANKTDVSTCNGESIGSITVTSQGGTGTITYTLNPGAIQSNTTGIFENLPAGTYTVDVDDENGCGPITTASLEIIEPLVLDIDTTALVDISCNGLTDGSIDVTITGGTSPYTFNWSTTNGSGLEATDEDQSGLGAGLYQLTVIDDNLCEATASFTINEPESINIEQTSVNNITCNGLTDGSIDITVTGGTVASAYAYNWATTDGAGLNATEQDQSGLAAGTYNVTVTDDNSCEETASISITEPDAITIDSENATDATSQTASDGSVQVTASGGTGTLQYTINPGGTSNETGIFGNLSSGDYTVSVTDQNSCGPVVSSSLTVGFPDAIEIISNNENIKIYPNPTSSKITLEISNDINKEYTIQILNIAGQVLRSEKIKSENDLKRELDISDYAKGIYFIKIITEKEYFQEKIILQ